MRDEGWWCLVPVVCCCCCCCCCCHCWLITDLLRSVATSWVLNQKAELFCGCFECKFNPFGVPTCYDSSPSDDVVPFKDDVAAFQVMTRPHIKSDVAVCSSNSTDLLQRFLCWCNFLSRLLSRPTSPHWVNHLSSMTLGAILQGTIYSCTQQLLPHCQSWLWWLILPTGTLVDSVLVNACTFFMLKLPNWTLSDVVNVWWRGAPVTALLKN